MPYDLPDIYEYNEDRDGKYCWFSGAQWATPIYCPLFTEMWFLSSRSGMRAGADLLAIPTCKSWDWKMKDGHLYMSTMLTTEEEKKRREPMFRERMAPILDDPFGYWEGYKAELKQIFDRLYPFDVKKAEDMELCYHFCDCWNAKERVHQIHHGVMYALGQGFYLFQDVCKGLPGFAPSDVKFSKLMSGFDNMVFQANKEMAELASRALELGLKELFDTLESEELLSKLEENDAGKRWLKRFQDFLGVYGMRWVGLTQEISYPSWIEKPSLAIPDIKRMMAIGGVHAPDMMRGRLVKERTEAEKEILAMVPEQREWLEKLMRCAQAFSVFSEDHVYYAEYYHLSLVRRAALELGKRFARAGVLNDPEDVFYLLHHEIVIGTGLGERYDFRPIVKRRKEERERYLKMEPPLLLGDVTKFPESVAADPLICVGMAPRIATPEEVGATLVGAAGAPGEVEGIARVIMTLDDLDRLQPGEILVTPYTAPPWTPVFGIIKAVVTDVGGALCHSVRISREYGIPAVVGTMEATRKIKTGQRVRVDGNLLRVYVLK